jgi:hypothetical protein
LQGPTLEQGFANRDLRLLLAKSGIKTLPGVRLADDPTTWLMYSTQRYHSEYAAWERGEADAKASAQALMHQLQASGSTQQLVSRNGEHDLRDAFSLIRSGDLRLSKADPNVSLDTPLWDLLQRALLLQQQQQQQQGATMLLPQPAERTALHGSSDGDSVDSEDDDNSVSSSTTSNTGPVCSSSSSSSSPATPLEEYASSLLAVLAAAQQQDAKGLREGGHLMAVTAAAEALAVLMKGAPGYDCLVCRYPVSAKNTIKHTIT